MRFVFAAGLLALFACISFERTGGAPCKVATDCRKGLFCLNGLCSAPTLGAACDNASQCPPLQACFNGNCSNAGCDATHLCNGGCCDDSVCTETDTCHNGAKCAAGICPARCDSAHAGNGCLNGCCDESNGLCVSGSEPLACGDGGRVCERCTVGASCTSHVCSCDACGADSVCIGGGCIPCSANPCSGTRPVCDSSSHLCKSCTSNPAVCTGATPYCGDDGACAPSPTSSTACARRDANTPTLLGSGTCGCDAQSACPNGFACNLAAQVCETSCASNAQCATGQCTCTDPSCTQHACTSGCGACTLALASRDCGTAAVTQYVQTPGCAGPSNACTAVGTCGKVKGSSCSGPADCASGFCSYDNSSATSSICAELSCGSCAYTADGGTSCTPIATVGATTPSCTGSNACDGAGTCKIANGAACSQLGSNTSCVSGFCDYADIGATGALACGPNCSSCAYTNGTACMAVNVSNTSTCLSPGHQCVAGACKLTTNSICTNPNGSECASGHCNCVSSNCKPSRQCQDIALLPCQYSNGVTTLNVVQCVGCGSGGPGGSVPIFCDAAGGCNRNFGDCSGLFP